MAFAFRSARSRALGAAAGALALAAACAAEAGVILYGDEAAFLAAIDGGGALTAISFDPPPPDGWDAYWPSQQPLNYPEASFASGSAGGFIYLLGPQLGGGMYGPDGVLATSDGSGHQALVIGLREAVTAFAIDLSTFASTLQRAFSFALSTGDAFSVLSQAPAPGADFVGFVSDAPFDSVTIALDDTGAGTLIADDVRFGLAPGGPFAPVETDQAPALTLSAAEPAGAGLLGLALLTAAAVRRRFP